VSALQLAQRKVEVLQRHRERAHEAARVIAGGLGDPVVVAAVEIERCRRVGPSGGGHRQDRRHQVHVDSALIHRCHLPSRVEHEVVDVRKARARLRKARPGAEPRGGAVGAGHLENLLVEHVGVDVDDQAVTPTSHSRRRRRRRWRR
jgi:hypothetical protein